MDGVLSDASRRQHYLDRPFRDWEAFFQACGDDDLIAEVARLLEVLDPDLPRRCCSPPARSGSATRPSPGSSATGCAGTCW